ncbi:MAG: hypothetical protein ACRD1T_26995, partial [Acidimicrobiia bacterium]
NNADFPQDSTNLAAERARTAYDRPHIFGAHYVWELPFFRDASRLTYNLLGGWQISGSTRLASGVPLTITTTTNSANSFGGPANVRLRPILVGDPSGPRTAMEWFNKSAFEQPPPNQFGNSPRSVVRGPGVNVTDLAFFKNFRVNHSVKVQYRLELFNAFNHTNLTTVGTVFGTPTFGQITSAAEPRLIQMGVKLTF